jgi:hypothetical protein
MDIREGSAMTEASGVVEDQLAGENASYEPHGPAKTAATLGALDARACSVHLSDRLRGITRQAPLQAVFAAFLLGLLVARRRSR